MKSMKNPIITGNALKVTWGKSGNFNVSCIPFEFRNCRAVLYLKGQACPLDSWQLVEQSLQKVHFETINSFGKWLLSFSLDAANRLTMQLKGKLKKSCNDIKLSLLLGKTTEADHLLAQGIKMGGCSSLKLDKTSGQEFEGFYQLLITEGADSLRLSYPLQSRFIASFNGKSGKNRINGLSAQTVISNYSGKDVELPPLTFQTGNGITLLQEYADENCKKEKDFSDLTAPGWNSWDYYRWTVTEDDILENAEFIAADPVLSKYVKRIIIDDGWQYAYGEWEANSLFPHGMKWLADKIRVLGMEPGLWVSPTILDFHSRIVQLHPEMLTKSIGGLPAPSWEIMKRRVFLLDPTVEASQQYIRDLFEKMLGWGYTYFKLDFLGSQLSARRFADQTVTQGRLMDLTIGTAYRQVAGRAKLLGCNYLFNGGEKIADIVRVGSDIHAHWKNIKLNAVAVAARFWSNKKLWLNDPDFALCRSLDTADDPEMQKLHPSTVFVLPDSSEKSLWMADFTLVGNDVYRPQMEVLLSIVLMAGGAVTLSDRMSRLNESGLDLARRVVAAESGEAAVPLDLLKSEIPSYWLQKLSDGYRVLMVNWSDEDSELMIDLAPYKINASCATNFWNDQIIPLPNGILKSQLPARSCLLVELKNN